ncbi:MAG: GIY-YIG nuclease family protein [Selenomonadaceae bacterium]|nr:GIY-YIG nuclease family protein [Selenomonadaceae bacterium]
MLIYKITCKLNNKNYIGKTTRSLEERIAEHLRNSRTSYIDRAIQKHGWENFSVEIIETCETLEQLNEREKFWIREFNCKIPNGYNLTDGGEGIPGYKAPPELCAKLSAQRKGRKVTPEQAAKISAKLSGREFTDEHKANISAAKMGHPVSDETRAKLAVAQTGKKASKATRAKMSASAATKRSVLCIETGEIFQFMKDAMAWAKISRHVLRKACLNENYIAGGYHWQYAD